MARPARVAVVGAGMAGASAARRLTEGGLAVTLFDKGRQIGGRMAHRIDRATGAGFDHGAQVMRAHHPAFRARLADWRARGLAAPWGEPGSVAAVPDMTAPVRDLLADLEVHVGCTVTGIAHAPEGWRLALAEAGEARVFDALVLTPPGPQALRLLAAADLDLPGLARATYAPCWSLMLTPASPDAIPGDILRRDDGPIAALFREDTKPCRPGAPTRVTVHAGAAWSRAHLEESPEAVRTALLAALADQFGVTASPDEARAHRWRYAAVETTCGAPCLYDSARRLGYGGDGCLGPRIEAAYDSGLALAERLLADLA